MNWTVVEPAVTNGTVMMIGMWGYMPLRVTGVLISTFCSATNIRDYHSCTCIECSCDVYISRHCITNAM